MRPYLTLMAKMELLLRQEPAFMLGLLLPCALFTMSTVPSVSPPPKIPDLHAGHAPPCLSHQTRVTLSQGTFGPVVQLTSNACLNCAFSRSQLFISNALFWFNVPGFWVGGWVGGKGVGLCLFVYRRMKYSYCTLFQAEVMDSARVNGTWD